MANDDPSADAATEGEQNETKPQQMNLVFRDNSGSEIQFKLKPSTRLKKAMDAFSARTERERRTLRFLFEGNRITDDSTPEELDMEDGDTIEVYTEQIGGGIEV